MRGTVRETHGLGRNPYVTMLAVPPERRGALTRSYPLSHRQKGIAGVESSETKRLPVAKGFRVGRPYPSLLMTQSIKATPSRKLGQGPEG